MMNFQQSDALGGLYEGRKARQAYDTAELQQQQTLEQIANAQQTREFNAAAEPGKRESEGRLRDLHPGALEIQQGTIEEARAKQAERLLVDWMRMPDTPNSEQYLMDRYKIKADNPYIAALREAKAQGPEAVEALRQKVATSDPKSRDAAVAAKNLADREDKRWAANQTRTETQQAGATERIRIQQQGARGLAEFKAQAAQHKALSSSQVIGATYQRVQDALDSGDPAAIQSANAAMRVITNHLSSVNTARSFAEAKQFAARARAAGIDMPDPPESNYTNDAPAGGGGGNNAPPAGSRVTAYDAQGNPVQAK